MPDKPVPLTFDQAVAMLPDGDEIHAVRASVPALPVGCNWPRKEVIDYLKRSRDIEEAGPVATRNGHGLAARESGEWVFFETRET